MNHRSVRLSSACTALVTMSGAASLNTSRNVDVRLARGVDALRGQRAGDRVHVAAPEALAPGC